MDKLQSEINNFKQDIHIILCTEAASQIDQQFVNSNYSIVQDHHNLPPFTLQLDICLSTCFADEALSLLDNHLSTMSLQLSTTDEF